MKATSLLIWLGVIVLVGGLFANVDALMSFHPLASPDIGVWIQEILSPLWQGGVLFALAKILEAFEHKN